ncbi:hypothetical protein [Streptomyces iranensis]|uniref:Uncharacterized protein n=1 Tax=Streptomyces iranensis TaxID=576784 RepID=A0A060ZMI4_9ACTN|nr:hypothetical protein [Streptomyces iranensis]MBP2062465.1 hypothetical protein [Streptomyces iranensis]CDR07325.1 predicted protein [Streptomyces iranensis]
MDDIVRTAEQVITLTRVRDYIDAMGLVDLNDPEELASRLAAARNLLTEVSATVTHPTADDVEGVAEQILILEAVRALVSEYADVPATDTGRLLGHLMTTEVQLIQVNRAFGESEHTA